MNPSAAGRSHLTLLMVSRTIHTLSVGLEVEGFNTDTYLGASSAWMVQYGKHKDLTPLSELNDHHKLSFARIADIIEKRVGTH